MPCHAHAALCRGLMKSLSERHGRGMARVRHGMCESNRHVSHYLLESNMAAYKIEHVNALTS
jgi:hypothetical protein